MNPLFFLLGLLGFSSLATAGGGSSDEGITTSNLNTADDDDDNQDVTNTDSDISDDDDRPEPTNDSGDTSNDDEDQGETDTDNSDTNSGNDGSDDDDRPEPTNDSGDTSNDDEGNDTPDQGNNDETPAAVSIALVAYNADFTIAEAISDGQSLDFGSDDVSGHLLGAEITGDVQSVLFQIGDETYVQNIVPYNTPTDAIDFSDGTHAVTVTAHSEFNGEGDLLATETFTFNTTADVVVDTDNSDDMGDTSNDDDGGHDDMGAGSDDGDDSHGHDDMDAGSDDGDDSHGHNDMGAGSDDGGHGHDSDDDGNDMPDIPPPGVGASAAEINAFVTALAEAPEVHAHDAGSELAPEHMAAMDLVGRDDATHVAIGDGEWDDPNIWSNGEVPGDDAKVLIPDGVTVDYSIVSDARLFTVRVDGKLDFATDTDSQIIFDTFVVSPTGHLEIGTATDPVDPNVNVDLIVANNGPIDTDWDPTLLSRGLISHGEATIHGAVKDSHDKVTDDPMEGDTSVQFDGAPEGWQVGDTIVIAGTFFEGYTWDDDPNDPTAHPSEDEVRVITQIDNDGTIHFDDPLIHDHATPRADLKTSVANYTRNVSVETENAEDAEVYERGHVMFMHSDDVDVRYAEFHELGRTDKSEDSANSSDFNEVNFDTNVQGRYSLHLHRTGVDDLDNPAIIEGNAVYGSPGWGFVHHDSNAELTNNASFDTYGAGFVAETGNETGAWDDNIAIYAQGIHWAIPKNTSETESDVFDTAKGGHGFWFQGRLIDATDNVAASVNTGFVYFHRDGNGAQIPISADQFDYPAAMFFDQRSHVDHAPIRGFDGNETFAAREGLHIVKGDANQEHDVSSVLSDFTAWSVTNGAHLEYTSHYVLTNFDLIGKEDGAWSANNGISFDTNASDITIVDARIDGFNTGIDLHKHFNAAENTPDQHQFTVIDADITGHLPGREFEDYDPKYDTIISRSDLPNNAPELNLFEDRLFWDSGSNRNVVIEGTKTDTLGTIDYPTGIDSITVERDDMVQILERTGYWETSDGERYTLVDFYFTDRATGDIFFETQPVFIGDAPLGSPNADGGRWENAVDNGIQDFTVVDGIRMAGDRPLDVTIDPLLKFEKLEKQETLSHGHDEDQSLVAQHSVQEDLSIDEALSFEVDDEALFINVTDITNADLTVTGGTAVLAAEGAEFDLASSRTLAVFDAAAQVGFDGEDGDIALLDLHEGSTVAFGSDSGDLGTIEEISSGAFGNEPNVLSGIDLGNATLSIDLAGLSADAGNAFTLMDADEIVGIFEEAVIGGLGARNATIVVDYETDSVSLQLSEGDGTVAVETLGVETDVTSGEEALWAALTVDQGTHGEVVMATSHDDEDDMFHAA